MGNLCCKQSKVDPDQIQNLQNPGMLPVSRYVTRSDIKAQLISKVNTCMYTGGSDLSENEEVVFNVFLS